jgi:hypothetical protein
MFKSLFNRLYLYIVSALFFTPYDNYVPGTPTTLSGMGSTGLRRISWEKKLRDESVMPSVFEDLPTSFKIVDGEVQIVKAGIFMKIETSPDSGQSVRVALRRPLRKAPQLGTGTQTLGNEDEQSLLYCTLYYNEIHKGIKYKTYGYDYNDTAYLKFIEGAAPAIKNFVAEYRDTRIHQSLMTSFGPELSETPVSLTPAFNKNWAIPNLLESSHPSWDKDDMTETDGSEDSDGYYSSRVYSGSTTFAENLATALMSASGTGSTSKALLNVDNIAAIKYRLEDTLMLETIMIDNIPTIVLLMHPRVRMWMMNPNNTGSLGAYWQAVAAYANGRPALTGEIGRLYESFMVVVDHRAPTLVVGGSSGSYTLKPGYLNPGNNDDRNNSAWSVTSGSTNYAFDMCIALGANALAEYIVDPLTTNLFETTNYGQTKGQAAYVGSGLQTVRYDKDAASQSDGASTTQIQRGSALIPVSRANIATIS